MKDVEYFQLDTLMYSTDRKGPFRLYVYDLNSQYHRGGVWFRVKPKYPNEEISVEKAKMLTDKALGENREVRICDGGDMIVFHAKGNEVRYGKDFFKEIYNVEAK